jgi:hypothetical protein
MADKVEQAFCAVIAHSQFQMLGRKPINQRHCAFQIINHDNRAEIGPALPRNRAR